MIIRYASNIINGLLFRARCSDIKKGQVAAVPIENSLSLLAQPRASKLLHRLRSHSLRSEAALKVFYGYMPHLSSFGLNRYSRIINATNSGYLGDSTRYCI